MELDFFSEQKQIGNTQCRPFIANLHPLSEASDPKRQHFLDAE